MCLTCWKQRILNTHTLQTIQTYDLILNLVGNILVVCSILMPTVFTYRTGCRRQKTAQIQPRTSPPKSYQILSFCFLCLLIPRFRNTSIINRGPYLQANAGRIIARRSRIRNLARGRPWGCEDIHLCRKIVLGIALVEPLSNGHSSGGRKQAQGIGAEAVQSRSLHSSVPPFTVVVKGTSAEEQENCVGGGKGEGTVTAEHASVSGTN